MPRYRNILEFADFAIMLFLFVLFLNSKPTCQPINCNALNWPTIDKTFDYITWPEVLFCVFAFGFLLDEFTAAQEHGWDSKYLLDPLLMHI